MARLWLAGLAALVGGCVLDPAAVRTWSHVQKPERAAVIFFADGLDHRRLDELLGRGELPTIAERFVRGGVTVEHAVTSLPPITYPNCVSLITGLYPGHHGILGNRWFDRHSLKYQDYLTLKNYLAVNAEFSAPTLFDVLADQFTLNVHAHTRRGVSFSFDNPVPNAWDWVFADAAGMDARIGVYAPETVRVVNQLGRWPVVWLNYFPGIDEIGHTFGPDSRQYADCVRNLDRQIAKVCTTLDVNGMLERSYLLLVTDHGHVQTPPEQVLELRQWLDRHRGWRIWETATPQYNYVGLSGLLTRYDAVLINGAYRRAVLHLRGPGGWHELATREQVEAALHGTGGAPPLYEPPAVAVVCIRGGPDAVEVYGRGGAAAVERRVVDGRKEYRVAPLAARGAADPAALLHLTTPEQRAFVDSGWHGSREWLAATATARFPDFVAQVVEMFDSVRAGDIVIFADDNSAFSSVHPGGHGSCLDLDMHVPMFVAGPDLQAGAAIPAARLVDVMPTIVDLLGFSARLNTLTIDGVSVAAELRAARPAPAPAATP